MWNHHLKKTDRPAGKFGLRSIDSAADFCLYLLCKIILWKSNTQFGTNAFVLSLHVSVVLNTILLYFYKGIMCGASSLSVHNDI